MKTITFFAIMLLVTGLTSTRAQDTWTQKADFGGTARFYSVGFSIGSKGYLGTGTDYNGSDYNNNKDFWEYDPEANTWTQKADFGGTGRFGAVGFTIGSKGYLGTGISNIGNTKDF
jgi:N-acetylneuraminic acid mutarotase